MGKHIVLRILAFSVVLGAAPGSAASELREPFGVVFMNHLLKSEATKDERAVKEEFAPTELRLSTEYVSKRYRELYNDADDDFPRVTGNAHFFDKASQRFVQCRFLTIPNRAAFERVLQHDQAGMRTIEKVDATKVILRGGTQQATDRRPTIRLGDIYHSLHDDLLVSSTDRSAFSIRTDRLSRLLKKADDHDWLMWTKPRNAPPSARKQFFERFARSWGVLMQKMDNEADSTFSVRNTKYALYRTLLDRLVHDTTELTVAIDGTRPNSPYRVSVDLQLQPKSEFATMISKLHPKRRRPMNHSAGSPVSVHANLVAPEIVRDYLTAVVDASQLTKSIKPVAKQLLKSGKLDASMTIPRNEGIAAARISLGALATSVDFSAFEEQQLSTQNEVETTFALPQTLLGQAIGEYGISAGIEPGGWLVMTVAQTEAFAKHLEKAESPKRSSTNPPKGRLVSVRLDLTPTMAEAGEKTNSNTNTPQSPALLSVIEALYQRFEFNADPRIGKQAYALKEMPSTSVLNKLRADGDWTLKFDLSASGDGEKLNVKLQVGRELFGLLQECQRRTKSAKSQFIWDNMRRKRSKGRTSAPSTTP